MVVAVYHPRYRQVLLLRNDGVHPARQPRADRKRSNHQEPSDDEGLQVEAVCTGSVLHSVETALHDPLLGTVLNLLYVNPYYTATRAQFYEELKAIKG